MRRSRHALLLLLSSSLAAQTPPATPPATGPSAADTGLALPMKPVRTLRFTTDEGTWMSLDVSPDGRTIVFDLLGDLYTISMAGGKAARLTSGIAWDCMPRWSPDGRAVAFITDRDGGDNLWIVNADGTGMRRLTKEMDNALSSPIWTPDGEYLIVRRFGPYPSAENYLTNVPLWIYHKDGGSGAELYPASTTRKTTNTGAAVSPDGRFIYFGSHAGGYAGETIGGYQIIAFDRHNGTERPITAGAGGGLRPVTSRDGRWLVYATRAGTRTALRLRDLRSQDDQWLVGETQRDDQEGYAPNDVFPGYAFTPDSRAVVFTAGGKIRRVDLATKQVTTIPFSADIELGMAERIFVPLDLTDGPVAITQLQHVSQSADGERLAFSAIGKIWTAGGGGSAPPRRLTNGTSREYFPTFSPDGRWIAYVTWSDSAGGHLWKARTDGSGTPQRLTDAPAWILAPRWSPEGDRLVYTSMPAQIGRGASSVATMGELRWIPAAGGQPSTITRSGSSVALVTANASGNARVYFTQAVPNPTPGFNATQTVALHSVRYDGSDRRQHIRLTVPQASSVDVKVAPDERAILVLERDDVYALPLTDGGSEGLLVNMQSPALPVRRLTTEGANYAEWGDGGGTILWSFANHIYRASRDTVFRYAESSRWNPRHSAVTLTAPRAIPQGRILLRGARIITMKGEEVIERGDILVENNRIAQIGASLGTPAGARVVDVSGKTIIPGIVDVHAHPRTGSEVAAQQEWSIAANLAYGVTTTRNPSGSRQNIAWGELIETGEMVGSRIFATGPPLTSNNVQIRSSDDALRVVRRYKQQGVHSIKQYLQPRRIQRQWVQQAALAEKINATNEGAGDLKLDIQLAIDGYSAFEHSIGQVPLYKDVVTVLADSKIAYTPTLVVAYGGPSGDGYWRARTDLDKDPKAAYFTPSEVLTRIARRRPMIIEEDYIFPLIARGARDVVRAGGFVGLGSHGQQDGPAAHWELWMLRSGDMTNHEALRIATILGAETIGYAADIGSLELGKLADLVVLDSNPLDDIKNSMDIRYVMKNGELFDGMTLDRIWPGARKFPKPHWVAEREALDAIRR
jgi:Tol biopolymer transport system component/imidazolonepropionase-like amidohydrolase